MTDTPFCSLDADALAARMAAWADLDHAIVARSATEGGAEVRYRLEPGLADRLLDLIRAECVCCPSLVFEATVTVAISAPPDMRAALRELVGARSG